MNTAVPFSLLLCGKLLFYLCECVCTYIYIYKYIYLCVFKFVCVHAPPLFRSTEAEGLTSALPETAAPHHVASDNTPAHHSVPYFWFLFFMCAYLLNFSSARSVAPSSRTPCENFFFGFAAVWARPALSEAAWSSRQQLFQHWACVVVARWRYSPDAWWLRCEGSINEQQIRTGGEKTTAISLFSSPASTLSGQQNRSGERRAVRKGWGGS